MTNATLPQSHPRHVRSLPDRRLDATERVEHLPRLINWTAAADAIERHFDFPDFHHTMAFVNAVAWIAHEADHHPDLVVGYNRCHVRWSTHSAQGVTLKDLACAAQVDALQCP